MAELLTKSLQENLITLLAYNEESGRVVSNMLDIELMEGDYRQIAERCMEYWRLYDIPPGDHLADLFADVLEEKHNRRASVIGKHLRNMMRLQEGMNADYVMNQLRDFNRLQRYKSAIVESAEAINKSEHMALDEVEELWQSLLKTRAVDFSPGTRLGDHAKVLAHLALTETEFRTGVKELDRRYIVPARRKIFMLGGAAGRGKTWGLVGVGAAALMDRKKVVHVSCEIDEEEVIGRYYQHIFSISKRREKVEITELDMDDDKLDGFKRTSYRPVFTLKSDTASLELDEQFKMMGEKSRNLWVVRFKSGELTPNKLRAYLDTLEQTENFIPDMVIVDYLGIMKFDPKDKKGSLGWNCMELRAIADERNLAMVTAHQLNKLGEEASLAKGTHLAEDWSIMGTCDTVVIYSVTDLEFRYGLGRLYVAKCRTDEDRFALLITQSYKIGQFCLESIFLQKQYRDLLGDFTADSDDYDADDTGGDDED